MFPYHTVKHISILGFSIESYRLMAYTAFMVCVIVTILLVKPKELKNAFYLIIYAVVGIIVGARLFFYFGPWTWKYNMTLTERFIKFMMFWNSGLVFYGGLVGAIAAVAICCKIKKLDVWHYLDLFSPGLALGMVFARIGCFLGGCCHGKPTSVPWAIIRDGIPIHPTQIYSSLNWLILFIILMFLMRKNLFEGYLALFGIMYYSVTRFTIEFFRVYDWLFLGLTASQWIAIAMFIPAAILFWKKYQSSALKK